MRAARLAVAALGVLALGAAAPLPTSADRPSARHGVPVPVPVSRAIAAEKRAIANRSRSVTRTLARLLSSGAITEPAYRQYSSAYASALRSLGRLGGTRAEELGAVLANVQAIADAHLLTPSRLPALFLTIERNRQWWTTEPLLSGSQRVSFPGSRLVWEYYPGQGIEIQWLATFGKANGYFLSGHADTELRELLAEAIPLASQRAGGIAWEYMFRFDGGRPPWTSGLSQGTGLQVLARAYQRFKEASYLQAARAALGVFEKPPPQGVRLSTTAGANYAQYTYAPSDHILNGFIQALVGLYDYTQITKDPLGLALFEAGDAEARAEIPSYDTGAWSLYDQYGESSLSYHELLSEFLQHLCERTRLGLPMMPPGPPASPPTATPPPAPAPPAGGTAAGGAGTGGAGTGGAGAGAAAAPRGTSAAQSAPNGPPLPADQLYCATAQHFTTDLGTPPAVTLISQHFRGGIRAGVQLSLSKVSTVDLTIRKGSRVVWHNSATVERGRPRLLWLTPRGGGSYTVTLAATDLAGNFATASGTVVVTAR